MNKIPWYVLFSCLAIIFIFLAVYYWFMKDPSKGVDCAFGCAQAALKSPWLNGPECLSIQEKYKDSKIPAPSAGLQPFLSDFRYIEGVKGGAFCIPAWYAFRYVRNKDGGYGPLSQWSGYDPKAPTGSVPMAIYACATSLPCVGGTSNDACSSLGIKTGPGSSAFNRPTLAITNPIDFDIKNFTADGYTLNVHRQLGYVKDGVLSGFDPSSEGEIVGMFIVYPVINGKPAGSKYYADFKDGLNPPNPEHGVPQCC